MDKVLIASIGSVEDKLEELRTKVVNNNNLSDRYKSQISRYMLEIVSEFSRLLS